MYLRLTIQRTLILILDMAILSAIVACILRNYNLWDRAIGLADKMIAFLLISTAFLSTPTRLALLYRLLDRPDASRDRLIRLSILSSSYMLTSFFTWTLIFIHDKPMFNKLYPPNLLLAIGSFFVSAIVTANILSPKLFMSAMIALSNRISRSKK